jgi:hypothetical protein
MSGLRIQYEMVKTMAMTESLMFVAAQIFGKGEDKDKTAQEGTAGTVEDAMAAAARINALG